MTTEISRASINALVRANHGRLYGSPDKSTAWYLFDTDDNLLSVREQIPFLNLWQGTVENGQLLIVYFDRFK